MQILQWNEYGHDLALQGLALNKNQHQANMYPVARKLAGVGGGHDKFMRQIMIWALVRASQTFWLQYDTYNFTVNQSQSKMHTILKAPFTHEDFLGTIDNQMLSLLENLRVTKKFDELIRYLPMSYLQTRMCVFSYAQLNTIIQQRQKHKYFEWREFCNRADTLAQHTDFGERAWR